MPGAFRLKHRHHHQVARAERAIEPAGTPKAAGKLAQPVTDAIRNQRHALRGPGLVALKEPGGFEFKDRRLHQHFPPIELLKLRVAHRLA